MKKNRSAGFTIIELLIATVVFSIVLLTISAAIIQIGRLYFKGITSARTQEVARSVMDDIAQAIQFDTGVVVATPANGSSRGLCVATKHYSYALGQQREGSGASAKHALVVNNVPSGCTTTQAQDLTAAAVSGTELLGEHMRLSNLSVQPQPGSPNTYKITVRVVYGDFDLLCSPQGLLDGNVDASCTSTIPMTDTAIASARDLRCKDIRSGTQFCAASELSTIVERRL